MQKYRANIDEIQDLPDEDVFEYLSENGFTEGTDKNGKLISSKKDLKKVSASGLIFIEKILTASY